MRTYNYIFYRTFQILSVFNKSPGFAAILVLCWLFLFNSCTIISCVIKNRELTIYFYSCIIVFTILIIMLHFLYFYRKSRYLRIIKKYKDESRNSSIAGIVLTLIYMILTVWLFFKYAVPNIGGVLK